RDRNVTGVQTCALPISLAPSTTVFAAARLVSPYFSPWRRDSSAGVSVQLAHGAVDMGELEPDLLRHDMIAERFAVRLKLQLLLRSEERRVGKEGEGRCS